MGQHRCRAADIALADGTRPWQWNPTHEPSETPCGPPELVSRAEAELLALAWDKATITCARTVDVVETPDRSAPLTSPNAKHPPNSGLRPLP